MLSTDLNVVTAIFNEKVTYTQESNALTYIEKVSSSDKIIIFPISLDLGDQKKIYELKEIKGFDCIEVKINLNIILDEIKKRNTVTEGYFYYLRFRVVNAENTNFIRCFEQEDKFILSSNLKIKMIDFRINESRWIPWSLNNFLINLKKVHCFLTINRQYEIGDRSDNFKSSRSLQEEPIWEKYVFYEEDQKDVIKDTLGYHWKSSNKSDDNATFSILGRFSRVVSSKYQIVRFILFIISGGVLASAIVNLFNKVFEIYFSNHTLNLINEMLGLSITDVKKILYFPDVVIIILCLCFFLSVCKKTK